MKRFVLEPKEKSRICEKMSALLDEYDYNYSIEALDDIVEEWAKQKQELISALSTHPNYNPEEFAIVFSTDYERKIDIRASVHFRDWIESVAAVMDLPEEVKEARTEGEFIPWPMFKVIDNLVCYAERTISPETTEKFAKAFPTLHFHRGEKTSRSINKICTYLGVNKHPDYNKEFAKYADSLSPMIIKRHTVISVNPLDYLTMSFGNSWASCHTIDKGNKRNMPDNYSGCYSSGTISYMLDSTSMVMYTTDAENEAKDFWKQPKITRQMFHFGEEKLIQGRLYPQDNDSGSEEIYTQYRNIVQQAIAECLEVPNLWTLQKGVDAASRYIISNGTNYPDYDHFSNCTLSRIKGSENEENIVVGEPPICVECGSRHIKEDNINCCYEKHTCNHCGCIVEENDIIWVNDYEYCPDCVERCEGCGEWEVLEDMTYIENCGYVCEDCRNEHFDYCEECDHWYHMDNVAYVESADRYVCYDCLDRYYTECDECGEYFLNESIQMTNGRHLCEDCYNEEEADDEEEIAE